MPVRQRDIPQTADPGQVQYEQGIFARCRRTRCFLWTKGLPGVTDTGKQIQPSSFSVRAPFARAPHHLGRGPKARVLPFMDYSSLTRILVLDRSMRVVMVKGKQAF